MSRPAISTENLSDSLSISERHRSSEHPYGFWLYDKVQGMNLAMGVKTKEAALIKAITYYQKSFIKLQAEYEEMRSHVENFVSKFVSEDNGGGRNV